MTLWIWLWTLVVDMPGFSEIYMCCLNQFAPYNVDMLSCVLSHEEKRALPWPLFWWTFLCLLCLCSIVFKFVCFKVVLFFGHFNCVVWLQVLNCHDSILYILAPLRYATIYGCSDATIVLGAVGKVVTNTWFLWVLTVSVT